VAPRDGAWKLLVVDNGSTDRTPMLLTEWLEALPLVILNEPIPGKNRALNTALSTLEGEFVILTDDDALPQPGFIDAWRRTMREHPDCDVFGGTIKPLFEVPLPEWHTRSRRHFDALFAANEAPDGPIDPGSIFGPNMAVRRRVFETGLQFREDIGPDALNRNYAMGSETSFCSDASRLGFRFRFASTPTVEHIVRPEQVTRAYFRARAYRLGRGWARRRWFNGELSSRGTCDDFLFVARMAGRRIKQALLWLDKNAGGPERAFDREWAYDVYRGYHDECEQRRWSR
jgi:glycosyltransferase involved in cell wall biosynthesis